MSGVGVNDQLTRSQSFCKKSFDNITLIIGPASGHLFQHAQLIK